MDIKVKTSEGHIVPWNKDELVDAIIKDMELLGNIDKEKAKKIAEKVEGQIRRSEVDEINTYEIRGLVIKSLYKDKDGDLARICTVDGISPVEFEEMRLGKGDSINANMQPNAETTHKLIADKASMQHYLKLMPKEIADAHYSGDIHIHDLEYFGTRPFCQDWDLRYFLYYGLMSDGTGLKSAVAGPAKHASVAISQVVQALGCAQTNFAGGQGYYNFLVFLAPYFDGMSYEEIKQHMQGFVYLMAQTMVARGGQTVFSSVQLTPGVPKLWRDKPIVHKGHINNGINHQVVTYGAFEREVRLAFKGLMEVLLEGDHWGKPFNFPKPEIAIEEDFLGEDWDTHIGGAFSLPSYKDLYFMAFKLAAKYGSPYFDNMLPAYRGHSKGGISCYQCCAYQFKIDPLSDVDFEDKMNFKDGRHFSMGSWQVVTINCPRAAYEAKSSEHAMDIEEFKDYNRASLRDNIIGELKDMMSKACEVFQIKCMLMQEIISHDRIPFVTQTPRDPNTNEKGTQAVDLGGLVYTIGVVGINEMVQVLTGYQLHESEESVKLAENIMSELKMYCYELTSEFGFKVVLARTPAETVAQRFAVQDLLDYRYKDQAKKVAKGDVEKALKMLKDGDRNVPVYYTNGAHVFPGANVPIKQRIDIESRFFPIVDGGNIFHIWTEEICPFLYSKRLDENANGYYDIEPEDNLVQDLMEWTLNLCKTTDIGYLAFSPVLSICQDCAKTTAGDLKECPHCHGNRVQHWERITGYMALREGFNEAKKEECKDRQRYKMGDIKG